MPQEHKQAVSLLQKKLRENSSAHVCLTGAKTSSNTTRNASYKQTASRIDISHLDRIVEVDSVRKTALVQPRISMYRLCKALLPLNLIPKVVPEFKGITVGGAINGCGGESNSHHVGLFHDNCIEYELLLGNGDRIVANREAHSDLFQALHGSYGSLALLTSAKIELTEAYPFVRIRYKLFSSAQLAVEYVNKRSDAQFLEGIIFSPTHTVIIEGWAAAQAEKPVLHLGHAHAPWFYQHARVQANDHEECIPLIDYLFRYDRGAFWMGAYVLRPRILSQFLSEGVWQIKKESTPWLKPAQIGTYAAVHDPSRLVRTLTASCMQSQPLFRLLHMGESWVCKRFIVQDLTLPESKVMECIDYLFTQCPVFPLWLCPVRRNPHTQLFCPSALNSSDQRCLNIGVYGIPNSPKSLKTLLSDLEGKVSSLQGRKWLYTNSEYSREKFWEIYPESPYRALREKYYSNRCFVPIDQKVLK